MIDTLQLYISTSLESLNLDVGPRSAPHEAGEFDRGRGSEKDLVQHGGSPKLEALRSSGGLGIVGFHRADTEHPSCPPCSASSIFCGVSDCFALSVSSELRSRSDRPRISIPADVVLIAPTKRSR